MTEEEQEELDELKSEVERLEALVEEYAGITRGLIRTRTETDYVEAIRKAAQVPLLWGRGDYSLGHSISQHILALIHEHNPEWGFKVLSKEEIEQKIAEREYVHNSMLLSPVPEPWKLLKRWALGRLGSLM